MDNINYYTGDDINNSLAKIIAIRSLLTDVDLSNEEISSLQGVQVINDFLEAPVNSPEELKLKKAFIAAVLISKELGNNVFNNDMSAEELSLAISEGLTRLKCQYLKGKGECNGKVFDETHATEVELDHAMASLLLTVERQIDKWCDQLSEFSAELTDEHYNELVTVLMTTLGGVISTHLSPLVAAHVVPFLTNQILKLKPEICQLVRQGATAVAEYLKPGLIRAMEKGFVELQIIKNWVKDLPLVKRNNIQKNVDKKIAKKVYKKQKDKKIAEKVYEKQ